MPLKKLLLLIFLSVFILPVLGGCWGAEISSAIFDKAARLQKLQSLTSHVEVTSMLTLYPKGWQNPIYQNKATELQVNQPGIRAFKGSLPLAGSSVPFVQASRVNGDSLELYLDAVPEGDVATEGLYWVFSVDAAAFDHGSAVIYNTDKPSTTLTLPTVPSKTDHVLKKIFCRGVELLNNRGEGIYFDLPKGLQIEMQDLRGFGQNKFSVFIPVQAGDLLAGRRYQFQVKLRLVENVKQEVTRFAVSSPDTPYSFEGFGGNYCFQLGSPVTTQTLGNLRSTRARVEMSLHLWEPENDNADPEIADGEYFAARVHKSEELREEFAMAKTLAVKGIPLVISVWHLPQWMYAGEEQESKYIAARELRQGIRPEMVEGIVSYLLYMRDNYGVEPELFSFNEPDIGIYVIQSAPDHAEFIKVLGVALAKAGLKTKIMLGDNASWSRCPEYWLPALEDREAMRYIGAVSYHTWGVPPVEYMRQLGAVAQKYGLPLILGEVGTDPGAYHNHDYFLWEYALGEIRLFQNLLNYSRASSLLYWEFTGDYPLFTLDKDIAQPTKRYWLMRQYCNWLPDKPLIQNVSGNNSEVSLVALYGKNGTLTLHLANLLGRESEVYVEGLPDNLKSLMGVVTGRDDNYRLLENIKVDAGILHITLPPQSLTTLSRSLPAMQQ